MEGDEQVSKEPEIDSPRRTTQGYVVSQREKFRENMVMTNLPLQMSLYYNIVFFPVWLSVIAVFLYDKYSCIGEMYKYLFLTILINAVDAEIIRLYLGYKGNAKDKIPELAAFWLISLLLQLPLQGFLLLNPYFGWKAVEIVSQSVMITMLMIQIVCGYQALKRTSNYKTSKFRILGVPDKGA